MENVGQLMAEFSETMIGRISERPQLQMALSWRRIFRSKLVIANPYRLACSVDLIAGIHRLALQLTAINITSRDAAGAGPTEWFPECVNMLDRESQSLRQPSQAFRAPRITLRHAGPALIR